MLVRFVIHKNDEAKHFLAKALAALYVALACLVIGSAAYVWRLKCEGFGCTGVGIAWFGWGVTMQLALGAIVLAAWVVKRVA